MKKLLKKISIVVIVLVLFTEYFTARATYAQGSQTYKTSVGRKEELKGLYPGYRVVDGKYDSDTTYEEFCKAIEAHEDAIIIYHGTENVVSDKNKFDAISDFQFFWLDRWTYCVGSDYVKVNISYLFDACETKKIKEQIDIIYSDIQYDITCTTDKSPWSAARYVYNYLTRTVTYDLNAGPHIRNIYGALIERRAVCKGYTAAFDYIMSRMGYQVGVAGNDKHIWNYMYWNSDDCFIDVTWGDPDCWDVYGNPYIDYSYMGLNVCELLTLKDHSIHYCYISGRGFYGSEVGSEYFYGIYDGNYCDICGYNAGYYSYETVRDIFYTQFCMDENSLIVKFDDTNALYTAIEELTRYDCDTLNQILRDIGYYGYYQYNYTDASKTFIIYLATQ